MRDFSELASAHTAVSGLRSQVSGLRPPPGKIVAALSVSCNIDLFNMSPDPHSEENSRTILIGTGMLVSTLVAIGIGLLLVWFALLRENQLFWTHAGGYPIWLRDLVLCTYLPLLLGTTGLLFALSMACFAKIGGGRRFFLLHLMLLFLGWGGVTTSGFIAFQNNILNLIHGKSVHGHK